MNSAYKDSYNEHSSANVIKLLLVDNNDYDREKIKRLLLSSNSSTSSSNQVGSTSNKYQIICAHSYQQALNCLEKNQFDICLFNYHLNGYSGLQLLKRALKINPSTSIIILSNLKDDAIDDDELLFAGAADLLHKEELTDSVLKRAIRYAIHHKKMTLEQEYLAHYDKLTQLINRNLFFDRLTHMTQSLSRHYRRHALLYIDIDYFKRINDQYGHLVGDLLLKKFANRLLENIRITDTAARLGGNEFIIILEEIDEIGAQSIAKKLINNIEQPFFIENIELNISASIGLSIFTSENSINAQDLLKQADHALDRAKHEGRRRYVQFNLDYKQSQEESISLENDFLIALKSKQIFPHYQAQYCLKTGKIVGLEALARWQHPQKGFIHPSVFIPIAEKLSLISSLTDAMLKRACADLALFIPFHPHLKMGINISASELASHQLLHCIEHLIHRNQINAHQLELEVTESVLIDQPMQSIDILNSLHQLGVSIAIDDFGTGYSSLSYLTELPIDILKIDMSFVQGIGVNPQQEVIIKVILDLAKRLSLKVIAEGIETEQQMQFLKEHNCDFVQGYYYSKPCDFKECQKLLEKNSKEQH